MTMAPDNDDSTQPSIGPRRLAAALRTGHLTRVIGLAAMLLGFMVALEQVEGLVGEREWMREVAQDAVRDLWGPSQRLSGPFLIVPEDRVTGSGSTLRAETVHRVITPRDLDITVVLDTETRRRGLFDVPVYTAEATLRGRFDPQDLAAGTGGLLARPMLALSTAGAASIVGTPQVTWNGEAVEFDPDLPATVASVLKGDAPATKATAGEGAVAAELPAFTAYGDGGADGARGGDGAFTVVLRLRGAERFTLAPSGRSTTVAMRSTWPHPSFTGSRTAETHEITDTGFKAAWRIGPFGRGFPGSWVADPQTPESNAMTAVDATGFGVALVQPVDPYRMTERTLKYGMLFALYTFGAFVLLETVFRRPLHWLHYLLTGASVASFFLLLLSLSELLGFAAAYALGAGGVVAQSGLYARAVLGDRRLALGFAGLLAALYAGLYGLLRLEDTALVTGSVGLFAAIGVAMVLTRKLTGRATAAA